MAHFTAHLSIDDDTLTETQRKLLRRDTLNRMLKNRPRMDELVERNIIFSKFKYLIIFLFVGSNVYEKSGSEDNGVIGV